METNPRANRPGDEAVKAKTGKTWAEWLALLDEAGAAEMSHKEIVAYLRERENPGAWWEQSITVVYEQERGLRRKHETAGAFEISRSKTINAPVGRVEEAWQSDVLRSEWLADPAITIRKATPGKSMRITWPDGATKLDVYFYPRGEQKTRLSVQHSKLGTAEDAERMKAYWEENLSRLKGRLE